MANHITIPIEKRSFIHAPMPTTATIVDDEPRFRDLLAQLLTERFPEVLVVGSAGSVPEATTLIKTKQPDLLFLDVPAIKFNALGFLVTPYSAEEFDDAVQKALRKLEQTRPPVLQALLGSVVSDRQVAISDGKGLTVLHLDDIVHCSSTDAYTLVHARTEKKPILVTRPLAMFDEFRSDKGCGGVQ